MNIFKYIKGFAVQWRLIMISFKRSWRSGSKRNSHEKNKFWSRLRGIQLIPLFSCGCGFGDLRGTVCAGRIQGLIIYITSPSRKWDILFFLWAFVMTLLGHHLVLAQFRLWNGSLGWYLWFLSQTSPVIAGIRARVSSTAMPFEWTPSWIRHLWAQYHQPESRGIL